MQHADSMRWHHRDGTGHRCKTDTVTVDGGACGVMAWCASVLVCGLREHVPTYARREIAEKCLRGGLIKGFLDDCRKVVSQVTCR